MPKNSRLPVTAASLSFRVAGVGASAGGLDALTALLKAMPPDTGISLVLLQHMDPTHESVLPHLLSKTTVMPVQEITDGMVPQPNHVYVAPAQHHLTISQGVLRLTPRSGESHRSLPIDDFFSALAADLKARAIGIILSGLANDGTHGLEAIKAEGGITFAQDRESARHTGMPASAVASGCVDFVLPPDGIAAELARLGGHASPGILSESAAPGPEGDDRAQAMRRICAELRAVTGVNFEQYKQATLQRRVARRIALRTMPGWESYLQLLQEDRSELDALYEDIFIHVTGFFRDPDAMQTLVRLFASRILEAQSTARPIRVWVPGCSSGEEAYSVAMLLHEACSKAGVPRRLQVFGTDISHRSVERARTGIYPEASLNHVSAARLKQFFVEVEGGFQISKTVRENCIFARHDLTTDPPFSRLDLISCRNVLIYMGPVLQKRILETFHYALLPQGRLLLGKSESAGGYGHLFSIDDPKNKIYARKPVPASPHRTAVADTAAGLAREPLAVPPAAPVFDLLRESERILLDKYVPPSLVVDPDLYIVHFFGDTSPYLSPAAGEASFHLLRMVRPEIIVDLQSAIQQARQDKTTVRREGIRYMQDAVVSTVDLEVIPVAGGHLKEADLLVVFRTVPAPDPADGEPVRRLKGRDAGKAAALARDLANARQQIRRLVENYEAAKEEMLAANEETLSNTEELQSANEELETAKEEMQASNEELTTLNEELQNRNVELGQITNDLGNLLTGVDIPVVILDGERRIRRFTQSAQQVFSLIETDVGRPFSDIASRLDVGDWDALISEAVERQHPVERETRDRRGRWYNLRLRPYRSGGQGVEGVLIALLDIDSLKRSLDELREARDFAEAIVETVREPLLVLDSSFRVLKGTPSFYETFLATHGETEGRSLFELGNGQWNIPRLRVLMEDLLPHGSRIDNFEVTHDFPALGHRNISLNARQLPADSRGVKTILLAVEDITERVRAEERLRIRELSVPDAASQAILSVDSTGRIVMANRMAETMFGYTRSELMDMPLEGLAPKRLPASHVTDRASHLAANKFGPISLNLATVGRRKDGSEFPIGVILSQIHTKGGMLAAAFITDLTEGRQAQVALRESEERFSSFMNHLPAAAFMKDREGRYVYVNPGFGKLTSLPPARCVGATDRDFWPESADWLREQDQEVIQTGRAVTSEGIRIAEGKARHFQTVRFLLPNADGGPHVIAGIAVEITERKLAERERQLLLARLATAREEEGRRISRELHDDLTQRLAGLAIDLGRLVEERPASDEVRKKNLRSLQRRVVQAAEVSRHIAHELHPYELDDLGLVAALRSLTEEFARREGIQIEFVSNNVPGELKREIASCIYKVTQESLTNIARHSGAKLAYVTLEGAADQIRITIRDTGAGFRVDSRVNAAGLGLVGMEERVELLHGTFGISSKPGEGTEITVEIPLAVR